VRGFFYTLLLGGVDKKRTPFGALCLLTLVQKNG